MTALADFELKKTPLYDEHLRAGGKMVGFGGWSLPVYYSSILAEHQWTRQSCSFFDVSHLGELRVQGKEAFSFLQRRLTQDLSRLKPGHILYNLLLEETGGILDDILVYCESLEDYYLIVNAANTQTDFEVLSQAAPSGVLVSDQSSSTACIAVQGPKAEMILEKVFGFCLKELRYYTFKQESFESGPVWVSRSGYTGEDGFEIFSPSQAAAKLWQKLLSEGKDLGALPAGLGARNTLRLEAGNLLCGSDMNRTTTPLEAGLTFAVALEKAGGFVGQEALLTQKKKGVARKMVAFKMLERSIARDHYKIFSSAKEIGVVTSGSYAPTFGGNIGLGYVETGFEFPGTRVQIEIHGQLAQAEIVKRPFVPAKHKKFKI